MKDKIGTYLTLWHGRKSPDENLNDWGETGPTFGPFEDVTITYATHVKAAQGGKTLWLDYTNSDLIEYDGVFYGDFTIFAGVQAGEWVKNPNSKGSEAKVTPLSEVPEKYFG